MQSKVFEFDKNANLRFFIYFSWYFEL